MTADVNTTTEKIKEAKDAPNKEAQTKLLDDAKAGAPRDPAAQAEHFAKVNARLHAAGLIPALELIGVDSKGNFRVHNDKTGTTDSETSAQFGDVLKTQTVKIEPEAIKVSVKQVHDAIFDNDNDKIKRILEPLNHADRVALEKAYQDSYSKDGATETLRGDLQAKLKPEDYQRSIAILNRNDTSTNDAGQLVLNLTKLQNGDKNATVNIREVLATLNPDQIKRLDSDLKSQYGNQYPDGLKSAIDHNPKLSDQEKQVLHILEKGVAINADGTPKHPGRTAQDNINLANIAVKTGDLNLLGEALRGDIPSATDARATLQKDKDFQRRVNGAFWNNKDVAQDFINQGTISLETIADANNQGYFSGSADRKNVELALSNASLDERKRYEHGSVLSNSGANPAPDSQDWKDLHFYQKTHDALVNLSRGNDPTAADIIDDTKPDGSKYLQQTLGMSHADLQKYLSDPTSRKAFDDKANGLSPKDAKFLSQDLLNQLATTGDISNMRPADKILYDALTGASPARTLLDAEKYLSDSSARHQMLHINSRDDKGYQSDGGTNKERDKDLLDIINAAARYQSTNAKTFTTGDVIVQGLLNQGKFHPDELANLGFPDTIVQARLKNASPEELKQYDQYLKFTGQNNSKTNVDLTKWEDQLLRGGTIISTFADHHKELKDLLGAVENLSQQDYERLHDPKLHDAFLRDIDSALKTDGVDDATRAKTKDLLERKGAADSYADSLSIKRSIVDAGGDKAIIIDSLVHLDKSEQQMYISDAAFRSQVDAQINKLDTNQKLFAQHMLAQLQSGGRLPTYDKLNATDKVLYDNATGASAYQTASDLQALLQDQGLRDRLKKDQSLHPGDLYGNYTNHFDVKSPEDRAIAEILSNTAFKIAHDGGHDDIGSMTEATASYQMVKSLLDRGSIDLSEKIFLHYPKETLYSDIAHLPEKDRQQYIDRLRLSDDQKKVLDNVINQNGNLQIEDKIRAFIVKDQNNYYDDGPKDNSKYSDFYNELKGLTPQQLEAMKSNYAKKYGSDFDNDFLKTVDRKDYQTYEHLVSPIGTGDGRQDYFDDLGKLQKAETGYIPNGPDLNAQRSLQLYATALGDAQSGFKSLSAADQEQFRKYFGEGLQQLQDAQKKFAETLIGLGEKAVMFGAGLIAIAASGGTLSPVVIAGIAAAGGTLDGATRLYILQQVEGANFNGSVGNVLSQFSKGFVKGSFDTLSIVTLPEVAGSVVSKFSSLLDAAKGGAPALEKGLSSLIAKNGANAVTEADIVIIEKPLLAVGTTDEQAAALAKETLAEVQAASSEAIVSNLSRTASDSELISKITDAKDLTSLKAAVVHASSHSADPAVQAAVKDAFINALSDTNTPFKDISDLLAAQRKTDFEFVVSEHPDAEVVAALERRATIEIQKNPNVFTDGSRLKQAIQDLRSGADPEIVKKDIVSAIDSSLTPEEKAAALRLLAQDNQPLINEFVKKMNRAYPESLTTPGDIKKFETILEKVTRKGADYSVERVGDAVRFKTQMSNIADLPKIVEDLKAAGFEIITADQSMVAKSSGWRGFNIDIAMPNGQVAEYQLSVQELEAIEGNHADYDIIRRGLTRTPEDIVRLNDATLRARAQFDAAWEAHLAKSGLSEEQVQEIIDQIHVSLRNPS